MQRIFDTTVHRIASVLNFSLFFESLLKEKANSGLLLWLMGLLNNIGPAAVESR